MASVQALPPGDLPAPMPPSPKSPSQAQAAAVGAALAKDLTLGDGKSTHTLLVGAAADSAAPLWFQKDAFSAAEFNADAYVNDLRRIVPLEMLASELESHLAHLNNELVELINRDYTDFVSVSTNLVDVEGAVLRIRTPLHDLKAKLQHARDRTAASLDAINQGLARRQEAAATRATLELMLDTANVAAKVEKLLAELHAAAPDSAENTDSDKEHTRARLLERIAAEVNRLKFYLAHGSELPLVQGMTPRIKASQAALAVALRGCLARALTRDDSPVALRCLLAYAAMDDVAAAEAVVRDVAVAPAVEKALAAADDDTPLPELLDGVLTGVRRDCGALLAMPEKHETMQAFDFLGNGLLAEVDTQLAAARPAVFGCGDPAVFLTHYTAATKFVSAVEALCPSAAALQRLRASVSVGSFLKRWNLSVYFTLRFQQVAGALDEALAGSPLAPGGKAAAGSPFQLAATAAAWAGLQQCWSPELYVAPLADRFLRLALQIVARYGGWLAAALTHRSSTVAAAAAGAAAGNDRAGASTSAGAGGGGAQGAAGGGGGDAARGSASAVEWAAAATPEQLAVVRADAARLASLLVGSYADTVSAALSHMPEEAVVAVQGALADAAATLQRTLGEAEAMMTSAVAEKCVEVLRQLKGITATYRMTNKPLPTRHSHFVPGVLAPLKAFVGQGEAVVDAELKARLLASVAATVTEQYGAMADDLVTTVRKTADSLKRLKGRKDGGGKDGKGGDGKVAGAATDTDKICHQLLLDVQEYCRQLEALGVEPAAVPSYAALAAIVAPPKAPEA